VSTPMSAMPDTVEHADPATDRGRRNRRIRRGGVAFVAIGLLALSSAACAVKPGSPRDAINRYFGSEAPYATRIAICESGLNPTAYSRTHDIGLFQINQVNWGWIRAEFGYTFEDLKDPYKNARVAKVIRDRAGWRAWSCSRKV
jgi:soluble lytic murein transglycosylase-like protein